MNPAIILPLASAGISLLEQLIPQISALVKRGEITPEQQADIKRRFESLRAKAGGEFSGPEWTVS